MTDQLKPIMDSNSEWKNKLNEIKKKFSRMWSLERKKKVYIFDCPFTELHPEIQRRYGYEFETYFENNIPVENTFYVYVEYNSKKKISDIDENADSCLFFGCIYKTMRENVYINVVYNKEQDRTDGITFDDFAFYEIEVEDELYCFVDFDYIEVKQIGGYEIRHN